MNLWAKNLRQLAMFAVALIFLCCEGDTIQGYKTNPKFKVYYKEFTLPSSVMLLDSIRTSNNVFGAEVNRLLLGQYQDPIFGNVKAGFYTQFYSTLPGEIAATPEYDSAMLELVFDFYTYGANTFATQKIEVYELTENLLPENRVDYTNRTYTDIASTPIGTQEFEINPALFQKYLEEGKDTSISVRVPLDGAFGRALLQSLKQPRMPSATFISQFKGIAVRSVSGDKMLRINPEADSSHIKVFYTVKVPGQPDVAYSTRFALNAALGYSVVENDWSGTPLSVITKPYVDYDQQPDRYIQSGAGVVTKVNFSEFTDFADSIANAANANILINSAEIVIDDVLYTEGFEPSRTLGLRAFDPNSKRLRKFAGTRSQDLQDVFDYQGSYLPDYLDRRFTSAIQFEQDSVFYMTNDIGGATVLAYDDEDKSYSGYATMFFQQLAYSDGQRTRPQDFVLYPKEPVFAKSVTRTVFNKDKIKLRIYYTVPQQ